jgi:hypothetical protein
MGFIIGLFVGAFIGVMYMALIVGSRETFTALDFRNDLVNRLNNNANRYVGGICNGHEYPQAELFEVDEVYEIIDRVMDRIPEDEGNYD